MRGGGDEDKVLRPLSDATLVVKDSEDGKLISSEDGRLMSSPPSSPI